MLWFFLEFSYVQNNSGIFRVVYQFKDHLGNVRLTYSDSDLNGAIDPSTEIISEKNYYPFGLKHKGYNNVVSPNGNSVAQKFGFQEQQLEDDLGLNWSSFKCRNHDPAIGRFMTIDPLTEVYHHWGPYVFSGNRVIDSRELEGLEPASVHRTIDDAARNFGVFYNGVSIMVNREYGSTIYQVATSSGIQYAYSTPNIGSGDGVTPSSASTGSTSAAIIHTHAGYDPNYDNNVFSGIPSITYNTKSTSGDLGYFNHYSLPGFVATPNGSLQKYDPISGLISTLPVILPFDVRDPTSPTPRPSVTPLPSITPAPITPVTPPTIIPTIIPRPPSPRPRPKPLPIIIPPRPKCLDC